MLTPELKEEFLQWSRLEHKPSLGELDEVGEYFEQVELPEAVSPGGHTRLEELRAFTNAEGTVVALTTRKIGNLRFKLKELVLQGVPKVIRGLLSANPIGLMLTGLELIVFLREIVEIRLTESDSRVIVALFKMVSDDRVVLFDSLVNQLSDQEDMSGGEIARSLEKLERLGCVRILHPHIVLTEEIVFISER